MVAMAGRLRGEGFDLPSVVGRPLGPILASKEVTELRRGRLGLLSEGAAGYARALAWGLVPTVTAA